MADLAQRRRLSYCGYARFFWLFEVWLGSEFAVITVGIRCLAAAALDHDGGAAGAIGISGPSPRVTDDRMTAWGELSARIGYMPDHLAPMEQE